MSHVRSGVLAVWGTAWLAGRASYDDVLDKVTGEDEPHRVAGVPGHDGEVPLGWALAAWRDLGATMLRLVLPVPGDPRGLSGPGEFAAASMTAGEGVVGAGFGLVPAVTRHGSAVGSVTLSVLWRGYPVGEAYADPLTVSEAEHDLTAALRDAASTLAQLDVASWRPDVANQIAQIRRADSLPPLPSGHDARAVRLLAQADRLAKVLELANSDAPGGALNGYEAQARADALRPLWTAVRRARLAAYNA